MTEQPSLDSLKISQLRARCVDLRREGQLPAETKCNGSRSVLLSILGNATSGDIISSSDPQAILDDPVGDPTIDPITDPRAIHDSSIDHTIDDFTYPLTDIPADVLCVVATYLDYGKMLALLAAYPRNERLVKGLYNHNSLFWSDRIRAQTGRPPLLVEGNALRPDPSAGPWMFKMQHDALVPRPGFVVMKEENDREPLIATRIRARHVIHHNDQPFAMEGTKTSLSTHVLLGEDGILRFTNRETSKDTTKIDVRRGLWKARFAIPDHKKVESPQDDEYIDPPPYIKQIVSIDRAHHTIVCLDYTGRLWMAPLGKGTTIEDLTLVELSLPVDMPEEDRQSGVIFIHLVEARMGKSFGINYSYHDTPLLLITMEGSMREYLVTFQDYVDTIIPVVFPVPMNVTVRTHVWHAPPPVEETTVGISGMGAIFTPPDQAPLYPTGVPYVVLPTNNMSMMLGEIWSKTAPAYEGGPAEGGWRPVPSTHRPYRTARHYLLGNVDDDTDDDGLPMTYTYAASVMAPLVDIEIVEAPVKAMDVASECIFMPLLPHWCLGSTASSGLAFLANEAYGEALAVRWGGRGPSLATCSLRRSYIVMMWDGHVYRTDSYRRTAAFLFVIQTKVHPNSRKWYGKSEKSKGKRAQEDTALLLVGMNGRGSQHVWCGLGV